MKKTLIWLIACVTFGWLAATAFKLYVAYAAIDEALELGEKTMDELTTGDENVTCCDKNGNAIRHPTVPVKH